MVMSEWIDIGLAPKDGTEIILMKGSRVTAGSWVEWQETESHYDSDGNYIGKTTAEEGASWCSYDGGFCEDDEPTHWMPLPKAK
jgi:hypothetical protein